MVQIILHATANLKGSDILHNTQPQTLHCDTTKPPRPSQAHPRLSQAPPDLSGPSISLTKRRYETGTASVPNTNRLKYRIRTPESSSHVDHLPITALGDNPSNHSYTVHTRDLLKRYARHTDTTHQCPPHPLSPIQGKRTHLLAGGSAAAGHCRCDTLWLSAIPLNTLHNTSTTAPHLRTPRSPLGSSEGLCREEAMSEGSSAGSS